MKADILKITTEEGLCDVTLHITVKKSAVATLPDVTKPLTLEIKKKTKKRSLDANSYCWALCQAIGEVVGATKEAVYQKTVYEAGVFDTVEVAEEALPAFRRRWGCGGLGWKTIPLGETRPGYIAVQCYYGSSAYDTSQMSRLINSLVEEAKELGVETDYSFASLVERGFG